MIGSVEFHYLGLYHYKFMKLSRFIIVLAFLFCTAFWQPAFASPRFLDDCVKGYDFGNIPLNIDLEIPPLNKKCYDLCEQACRVLSRKSPPDDKGIELNNGPIYECKRDCQMGAVDDPVNKQSLVRREYIIKQDFGAFNSALVKSNGLQSNFKPDIRYLSVAIDKVCTPDMIGKDLTKPNFTPSKNNPTHAIPTGLLIKKGESFGIVLQKPMQKIYRCGKKQIQLLPLIPNLNGNIAPDWTNKTTQNIWSDKNMHSCLVGLNPNELDKAERDHYKDLYSKNFSNWSLWHGARDIGFVGALYDINNFPNHNENTLKSQLFQADLLNYDNPCYWNARNDQFLFSKIFVQDGDDLSFTWVSKLNHPWRDFYFNNIMNDVDSVGNSEGFKRLGRLYIKSMDSSKLYKEFEYSQNNYNIKYSDPYDKISSTSKNFEILEGECARNPDFCDGSANNLDPDAIKKIGKKLDPPTPIERQLSGKYNNAAIWHGLYGTLQDKEVITVFDQANCKKEDITSDAKYNECNITTSSGYSEYTYAGKLDGLTQSRSELWVKHPNLFEGKGSSYASHDGGIDLTIDWGGCPIEDSGLEYNILINTDENGKDVFLAEWQSLDGIAKEEKNIYGHYDGELFLRIRPYKEDAKASTVDSYFEQMYGPLNSFGSYKVTIKPKLENSSGFIQKDGPIGNTVRYVYNVLMGEKDANGKIINIGVSQLLFETLVKDSKVINGVLAFVVLYLTFVGIGFVMGTIEMKQQDLIYRVIKVAIVLAVVSPNSWEFFYENFFAAIMGGGIQLMTLVVTGSFSFVDFAKIPNYEFFANQDKMQADPANIFQIFDGLITQLGSAKLWTKIFNLLLLGFMGFFLFFIVIVAILFYILAVLKSALVYMMSLVIISILIFTAPIFIPMMLFQTTKNLFDGWWKALLSFTLQPIGLFAGIAMFNIIFAATLYSALSFTVCPYCFLGLQIPGLDYFCFFWWWQPMMGSFMPDEAYTDSFSVPGGLLAGAVILLIIAHGMLKYCDFVTKVIGSIVSGELTSRSGNLSGYSGQAGGLMIGGVNSMISGGGQAYTKARGGKNAMMEQYQKGREQKAKQLDKQDAKRKPDA